VIDFQQIIQWFNYISKLLKDLQPAITEIKENTKTKTIDGIQFVDFDQPSISNIKKLNEILKENGIEQIDEELLKPASLDIEQILQAMQNEFTQEELAKAIEEPIEDETVPDVTNTELELADICAPIQEEETPEFNETELIDAACDPILPKEKKPIPVEGIPVIPPSIDLGTDNKPLPEAPDSVFDEIINSAKNAPDSDLFPKNGPDCIEKMKEITRTVQQKVKSYTDVKQKIQEIQLDYYYETIVNAYYESFIDGYGEVSRLNKEKLDLSKLNDQKSKDRIKEIQKKLLGIRKEYKFAESKGDLQKRMEAIIWSFSNQFDIDIDSGFLGLFSGPPMIKVNKDKGPISGKIRDIPDELVSYVDKLDKNNPNASKEITARAKKTEEDLEKAFTDTVVAVKYNSFAFGLNQFLDNDAIDPEFRDAAAQKKKIQEELQKKYLDLKEKEKNLEEEINGVNKFISEELGKMNCKMVETPVTEEAGKNLNFKNVSKNPTVFEYNWWVRFCKIATVVNLVPVHWPVGLVIPNPTGLLKIPLPIIWIPVFVAPTDKLLAVFLIGQCGILPCPYLFFLHFFPVPLGPFQSNNPYFALALGGPVDINSHEPLPPVTLPSFDLVFTAFNTLLESFRNGVTVDVNALLTEVKNQLENVERSALTYLADAEKNGQKILQNAKDQALQTVNSAKETAAAAIKTAQEEGQRMIEEARKRYQDANVISSLTLTITRGVQEKINEATRIAEEARKTADEIIKNAEDQVRGLKDRAQKTIDGIIETGKRAYEQKVQEIEQLKEQYDEIVKTLRDFIDRIKIPAINLELINLPVLLSSFTLALGALKALAADLSPKAIQFGFPTEISPDFSSLLPMLDDELPVWERLSFGNIPLLFFVWKWCKSGKYVGGLMPESIFGPV